MESFFLWEKWVTESLTTYHSIIGAHLSVSRFHMDPDHSNFLYIQCRQTKHTKQSKGRQISKSPNFWPWSFFHWALQLETGVGWELCTHNLCCFVASTVSCSFEGELACLEMLDTRMTGDTAGYEWLENAGPTSSTGKLRPLTLRRSFPGQYMTFLFLRITKSFTRIKIVIFSVFILICTYTI